MIDSKIMSLTCEKGKLVVNRCFDRGYQINTLKLEKLLLLMNVYMMASYQKSFFESPIESSKNGLRIPIIYKSFKEFGEKFDQKIVEYISLLDLEDIAVENVLDGYGQMDVFELDNLKCLKEMNNILLKTDKKDMPFAILYGMISSNIENEYELFETTKNHRNKLLLKK